MPAKTKSKPNSKPNSTTNKSNATPKSSSKKSATKKKILDESDDDFVVDRVSDNDSDLLEEDNIKKKLGSKLSDESDFEPLEPWDDIEREEKASLKKVKKSNTSKSGKTSANASTTKSTKSESATASKRGGGGRGAKTTTPKEDNKKGKKEPKSKGGVIMKSQTKDEDLEEGVFHNDENPQFDESNAFIPTFLQESEIRDINMKHIGDEGYDPTTLYVPPEELKKCRPVMKQYWAVKSKHFDKIVAIKMWKFYYFYFHDALIVHRVCDMKITISGNSTYTFFHESVMKRFAPKLLEAGHKIVIVEQMEEHASSNEEVIRREICQILTRGTATENQELDYSSRYMMAIFEEELNFGIVFVDTTTNEFHIGEFQDDSHRSNLRTLITRTKPVEIVYLRSYIEAETVNMLKGLSSKPSLSVLSFNEPRHFNDVFDSLKSYFTTEGDSQEGEYPQLLKNIQESVQPQLKQGLSKLEGTRLLDYERKIPFFATVQALAICLDFLKGVMLDETVVAMGNFIPFDISLEKKGTLYLDSQTLDNLEILEVQYLNSLAESRSLFGYMDRTSSQFGKRMLKRWLTSPLLNPERIKERQEAVEDLVRNPEAIKEFQSKLEKLPDLERMVSKIYNLNNKQRLSAIYFEDFAKNRLKDFLAFLPELKKVDSIIESLQSYLPYFESKRLLQLTQFKDVDIQAFNQKKKSSVPKGKKVGKIEEESSAQSSNSANVKGIFPKISQIVADLEAMVEIKDGLPVPAPGVSPENDEIMAKIEEIKLSFQSYLEQQKKKFNSTDIRYVHTKHHYELEVPERLVEGSKRPEGFAITSKKKGYLRFHTPEIEANLRKFWHYQHSFQKILVPFITLYFRKFYERNSYWSQVINCLGELDCLCSLANLANEMQTRCKPEILPAGDRPIFELRDMIHPMAAKSNPNFVPNDVVADEDVDIFLITGPNMGGKSTLLRQTCLAVIMAQVGSFVPASSFRLSSIDRIFTRVGASDRIMEGKSTFFIEMEETYNIVQEATKNSLLIIDELGRGTSTYDGVSIAYATLKYIAEKIKCITLFATHYHLLLEEFRLYKNIETYYMQSEFNEKHDEIKFLYKFGKGQASKSHGIVIAKVAGLPDSVITEAKHKAAFMTNEKRNISFEKNLMEKFNNIVHELAKIEQDKTQDYDSILNELSQLH